MLLIYFLSTFKLIIHPEHGRDSKQARHDGGVVAGRVTTWHGWQGSRLTGCGHWAGHLDLVI
jgi:hypothetical protein